MALLYQWVLTCFHLSWAAPGKRAAVLSYSCYVSILYWQLLFYNKVCHLILTTLRDGRTVIL